MVLGNRHLVAGTRAEQAEIGDPVEVVVETVEVVKEPEEEPEDRGEPVGREVTQRAQHLRQLLRGGFGGGPKTRPSRITGRGCRTRRRCPCGRSRTVAALQETVEYLLALVFDEFWGEVEVVEVKEAKTVEPL